MNKQIQQGIEALYNRVIMYYKFSLVTDLTSSSPMKRVCNIVVPYRESWIKNRWHWAQGKM